MPTLPPAAPSSLFGPRYIKTYLLPDKSNRSKRKTAVRKRSLDPVFNETLKVSNPPLGWVWRVPVVQTGWVGVDNLTLCPLPTSTSWRRGTCRAGP